MKKNKLLAAAMASLAVSGTISGCLYTAVDNMEPCVYGPKPANLHRSAITSDSELAPAASDAIDSDGETINE